MGVRGASQVLEQGGVEHVADLGVTAADDLGKTSCDQAALQRLLQRRPGAEVGHQREPAQQFQRAEHAISISQVLLRPNLLKGAVADGWLRGSLVRLYLLRLISGRNQPDDQLGSLGVRQVLVR